VIWAEQPNSVELPLTHEHLAQSAVPFRLLEIGAAE
jgi:hypothetical protein